MNESRESMVDKMYLEPSPGVDCTNPCMLALARKLTSGAGSPAQDAVRLFTFVRDAVRYIPYAPFQTLSDYEGAAVLSGGSASAPRNRPCSSRSRGRRGFPPDSTTPTC